MEKEKIILDGHKLIWHKERIKAWSKGERIAPITIDCALTRGCNYNCIYCYSKLQENTRKKITKDIFFNFLDDAAEIGVKAISLISDGESTCSPYWHEAVKYGKNKGLDMALGTNGRLIKKYQLKEVLPSLTYLRFNISAGEPKRYAKVMGCKEEDFYKVKEIITEALKIKRQKNLDVTIGLQIVLMPDFANQIMPLAKMGKELGVDYFVIKHCSDDENGRLGIDYSKYFGQKLINLIKEAEKLSNDDYLVKAKWSKILSGGKKIYSGCYGPPFLLQISGSGLVAPCGGLFNDRYKKFHMGNITETSFKEIWQSDKYWNIMNYISSRKFDTRTDCEKLCLQHKINEFLWNLKQGKTKLEEIELSEKPPLHLNFI